MAEINVKRKGPSIWPWVVGLIVLGLLIWVLTEFFGDDADEPVAPAETVGMAAPRAPLPAGPAGLLLA